MKDRNFRARSYLDPITDRLRPRDERHASKLPSVIAFAAIVGVIPLAFALDWLIGAGWLVSALGAIAIAAILALGAYTLIGS